MDDASGLRYERILVTGASGFIGCRLVEHLRLGPAVPVRAMMHDPARAARVARLDAELVRADLADPASLERALDGCDAIVHCAYGSGGPARERRRLTGQATARLADLALARGVRRFVHLSTVAVWGFAPPAGILDERSPVRPSGHPYVGGKIDAERAMAAACARGLPGVVLRPANVWGPWAPAFTVAPVRALAANAPALVGEGAASANAIYVDNLVHGIVRALEEERAVGETFVLSSDDVTWRELYEAYARLFDPPREVRSLDPARIAQGVGPRQLLRDLGALVRSPEAKALARAAAERPALRALVPGRLARRLRDRIERPATGAAAAPPPSPELAALHTSGVTFRTDKARDVLAYEPPVSFETAMRLTGEWLRFARLL